MNLVANLTPSPTMFLTLLFFYLACLMNVHGGFEEYADKNALGSYKLCDGADLPTSMTRVHGSKKYQYITSRYLNCTHITGHLSISGVDSSMDIEFLSSIVEVGGSVNIFSNTAKTIPLYNLRIIRGQIPYNHDDDSGKYSLFIYRNFAPANSTTYIDLRSLVSVLKHDIYVGYNHGACNLDTVNWKRILEYPQKQKVVIKAQKPCIKKSSCSSKCPEINKKRHCFGPLAKQCQQVDKCDRSKCASIKARCFTEAGSSGRERCCHEECAGGCAGISRGRCFACKNFLNGKECQESCPPPKIYSREHYTLIKNPNFKYTLSTLCVKTCPKHYLKETKSCVRKCSHESYPDGDTCKRCEGDKCGKVCRMDKLVKDLLKKKPDLEARKLITKGKPIHTLRSLMIALKNCTILDGDISITASASAKDGDEHIREQDFQNLKNLKRINGKLYLYLKSYPGLRNLSFLSNLESISSSESGKGLDIYFSNLEYLGLVNLKNVTVKKLAIAVNQRLCYVNKAEMKERFPHVEKITIKRNKGNCKAEGKVCDPACAPKTGCWGPGRGMCFACRQFKAGNECVSKCEDKVGFYTDKKLGQCAKCHPECRKSCKGSKADQCVGGCKKAQDGPFCVSKCPTVKYLNTVNGRCEDCSKNCFGATKSFDDKPMCTGPKDHPGPGGCSLCARVLIARNRKVVRCVPECPRYNYHESVVLREIKIRNPVLNTHMRKNGLLCIPCHRLCKTCYNTLSTTCMTCKPQYYLSDETQCRTECNELTYNSTTSAGVRVCLKCHDNCRLGCRGNTTSDCVACRKVKIYLGNSKTKFICNDTCPIHLKFKDNEAKSGDTICVVKSVSEGRKKMTVGLSISAFIIICIIVGCIIFVCVQRRRARLLNERELLRAKYTRKLDSEMVPLNTTDYTPNQQKLRMISAKRLIKTIEIGAGAFGTVFKGVWKPEKDEETELEITIDVAIKELKESGSLTSTKDFLSEAHVMASVDHPFCLQLLGVCLSTRMQLVSEFMPLGSLSSYLPKHQRELGSQRLLTWAMQIAKGMAYLESRGIVHRDLAARNVLLQSEDQVRITDFGLAKLLDPGSEDLSSEGGRFPVKWLAIESLCNRTFSHKSDVWSYGITLWEIFTFGVRPYTEVPATEIYDFLDSGERLKQPDICTLDMYMLLIKCWLLDPEGRPTFAELVEDITAMASDPGRYLIIEHDNLRRAPVHDTSALPGGGSTSPRVSAMYPEKPKPQTVSLPPPAPGVHHLESELARRRKPPSSASDHYSDDPVARDSAGLPPAPPPPPPMAVPMAAMDEDDEFGAEVGDFPLEQDYLIPDAGAGDVEGDKNNENYIPPSPQPSKQPPAFLRSKPPPPVMSPEADYVNQPALRNNTVHNPNYVSQYDQPDGGTEDYLDPDADEYMAPTSDADLGGADYLEPLVTKGGGGSHAQAYKV